MIKKKTRSLPSRGTDIFISIDLIQQAQEPSIHGILNGIKVHLPSKTAVILHALPYPALDNSQKALKGEGKRTISRVDIDLRNPMHLLFYGRKKIELKSS